MYGVRELIESGVCDFEIGTWHSLSMTGKEDMARIGIHTIVEAFGSELRTPVVPPYMS